MKISAPLKNISHLGSELAHVFGLSLEEKPRYEVLYRAGERDIRRYEPYIVARAKVTGRSEGAHDQAFHILWDYMRGNNQEHVRIRPSMPICMEAASWSSEQSGQSIGSTIWTMGFVLPRGFALGDLPKPRSSRVSIDAVPGHVVAVQKFSGPKLLEDLCREVTPLSEWAHARGYEASHSIRKASYDWPVTLPFLRRSELHVQLEGRAWH